MIILIGSLTAIGVTSLGLIIAKRSATEIRLPPTPDGQPKGESKNTQPKINSIAEAASAFLTQNGLASGPVILQTKDNSRLLYAVGTIRNTTDRQHFGVRVEMDVFGEQDTKIGSASDYIQVIEPGGDWKFQALLTDPKAVRATVVGITEK